MLKEFKDFALRGNVLDMAVGIVIGVAFGSIITSLVNDILMPPLGLLLGGMDFSNLFIDLSGDNFASLAEAQQAGAATINYGLFINAILNFLIVAVAMFLLVRSFSGVVKQKKEEIEEAPTTKECPYCVSEIPIAASRCPHCTSQL
ncbi:MAG TPA: large conductance mechanosensitive channel protein MscL [Anaerolineae bacterium]|nr:large conductance mechanosensitive channel protein MscL [Anaerolineae bacterium]